MIPQNDLTTPGSDAWWMQKCWIELKAKRRRLTLLENYRRGTPPVQHGSTNVASAFYRFQRQCRTNVADLVVQALVERLSVRTIRTAATTDSDGDVEATRMWQASGMLTGHPDVVRMLATFGESFTQTVGPDNGTYSRIVAEDPRECVVLNDAYGIPVAGFKLYSDPLAGHDYAILFRPGRKVVAYSETFTPPPRERPDRMLPEPRVSFVASKFTIRPTAAAADPAESASDPTTPLYSEEYSVEELPLVRHEAPDCVGVFERHLDLIDQINHIVLQGLVISTLQAFKQRALELTEPLPREDEHGNPIDYNDLFAADPGALWELPIGAKIWESGQVEITGILQQAKDALQRFAAVTRTPFSMFSSDSVNQSAEGAQLTREGLVFKAESFQAVETEALIRSLSIGFKFMPDDTRYADIGGNRVDRADPAGMTIDWLPAERYSLQERATADAAAVSLSRRQRLRIIWGLNPAEIDLTMAQVQEDALLAPLPAPRLNQTSDAAAAASG